MFWPTIELTQSVLDPGVPVKMKSSELTANFWRKESRSGKCQDPHYNWLTLVLPAKVNDTVAFELKGKS